MSFWNTSDGELATTTGSSYETPSGSIEPIPNNSTVLALIDEARWAKDPHFNEYISLRWSVVEPDTYRNRKIFMKLWVKDADPKAKDSDAAAKKRDKALRMLAAIDANCGGKLGRRGDEPEDDDLSLCLTNRPMVIRVQTWEIKDGGETKSGNWISGVSPKSAGVSVKAAAPSPAQNAHSAAKSNGYQRQVETDDVPF